MADNQKISELFMNNFHSLPLWVKQVVFHNMEESIKEKLDEFMSLLNPSVLLQEIAPVLTFKGKREIEEKTNSSLSGNHYVFLQNIDGKSTLFDIALNNFWTMAEISKLVVKCIECEYIENFAQEKNYAIALYLAGRIRTGELLRKLGKLDVMQLEQVIREQKARKDAGKDTKIAQIMIEMGFIREKDVETLLAFKDESDKRFVMGLGLTTLKFDPENDTHKEFLINLQREFKRLDQENRILKARLKKILNIKD